MKIATLFGFAILSSVTFAQEVSVKSLLPQMTDLTYVTHRQTPAFKMAQASSYDRHSDPGPNSDPFANGDYGNFVRIEDTPNGKEYVMADLKGPGAVVRLWSANPSGTIRFYFDGETIPRIKAKMNDFLTGKFKPLDHSFGYVASGGCDVYFPFPYAKSLKITVDESEGGKPKSLYYHVGYRTYDAGTAVKTFSLNDFVINRSLMTSVSTQLENPKPYPGLKPISHGILKSGEVMTTSIEPQISSAIRELQIKVPVVSATDAATMSWGDPRQTHNVLRQLIFTAQFDGEKCVEVPLGDFFGSAPGINPYENYPMTVSADGTLTCRFVMPFEKSAVLSIRNIGQPLELQVAAAVKPYPWDKDTSYHFNAQWLGEHGSTRPFHEMTFLDVKGEGYFIGSNLHVANPTADWWGEGDEKAYVDGESFPSTFGTGSEDYYGYAWSSPQLFVKPYHAQTRCDGPGTRGHDSVNRWQIFDPISYTNSLKFTLEMWHWADCITTFVHTAYWYAKPGGTGPASVDESILLPPEIERPKPVPGAIEGEGLRIISKSGGVAEVQDGFAQISSGKQLWWRQPKPGDRLVLEIPVSEAGTYEVIGNFCHAADYGIHKIKIDGHEIAPIDFYRDGLDWSKTSLGTFNLPKGLVRMEIVCVGKNSVADPQFMFGLDYLLLNKK